MMPRLLLQIINHHLIFSDANDFVKSLPLIPSHQQASSSEENHGRFSTMFGKKTRSSNPVLRAAYWGSRKYYVQNYPKDAADPTIVLQFMMLYPKATYDKEFKNEKENTPLHLAAARGNLDAVRILMESKATKNKKPINKMYFILFQKLGYEQTL